MLVAAVAQRLGAERGLGVGERDHRRPSASRPLGDRHRHLEAGEHVAAVAVGVAGQVLDARRRRPWRPRPAGPLEERAGGVLVERR